jgi:hypothetical protein
VTDFEQLEAWIERRMIERRATRGEVYALRRLRRANTPRTRGQLVGAYLYAVFTKPLIPVMERAAQQMADTARAINKLVISWNLAQFEAADLGEFDNRAQDWLRCEGSPTDEATS